jgi:hypothetical protein
MNLRLSSANNSTRAPSASGPKIQAGKGLVPKIAVQKQLEDLALCAPLPLIYTRGELRNKFILLDLTEQFLRAYEFRAHRFGE